MSITFKDPINWTPANLNRHINHVEENMVRTHFIFWTRFPNELLASRKFRSKERERLLGRGGKERSASKRLMRVADG